MAKDPDEEQEDEDEDEQDSEDEEDRPSKRMKQKRNAATSVSLYEPMSVWITLLLIAVVLKVLIVNPSLVPVSSQVYALANIYSNFILQFPGTIILPLIIGAIIGSEIGRRSTTMRSAVKGGVLNGIYAAVVYLIAMTVIYMIMNYTSLQSAPTYTTIMHNVVIPIVVFLVTLEVFAVLSHLRKVE
jgi:hypothetical protein